jgi:hypothetical protein
MSQYAATQWIRFEPESTTNLGTPMPGEWCLWSFVTEHGREYYSGTWYRGDDNKVRIKTEYGWTAEAKDVYFARVNKLPAQAQAG